MNKNNTLYIVLAALAGLFLFRKQLGIGTVSFTRYDEIPTFTIDQLNKYIQKYFPDSFKAEAYYTKNNRQPVPDYDKKAPSNTVFRWDISPHITMFQGGENTYWYWFVYDTDQNNYNPYVISFGMKDRGDVDRELVPSFTNWLLSRHKEIRY